MNEPPCFENYGRPTVKILTCDNCNYSTTCKRRLQSRLSNLVKIKKLRGKKNCISFDLYTVPFNLTPSAVGEIRTLYFQYGEKNTTAGISYVTCYFDIYKEKSEEFAQKLRDILTNIDNLKPID